MAVPLRYAAPAPAAPAPPRLVVAVLSLAGAPAAHLRAYAGALADPSPDVVCLYGVGSSRAAVEAAALFGPAEFAIHGARHPAVRARARCLFRVAAVVLGAMIVAPLLLLGIPRLPWHARNAWHIVPLSVAAVIAAALALLLVVRRTAAYARLTGPPTGVAILIREDRRIRTARTHSQLYSNQAGAALNALNPRGVVAVDLRVSGAHVRVLATQLTRGGSARIAAHRADQARQLAAVASAGPVGGAVVLAGDLGEADADTVAEALRCGAALVSATDAAEAPCILVNDALAVIEARPVRGGAATMTAEIHSEIRP